MVERSWMTDTIASRDPMNERRRKMNTTRKTSTEEKESEWHEWRTEDGWLKHNQKMWRGKKRREIRIIMMKRKKMIECWEKLLRLGWCELWKVLHQRINATFFTYNSKKRDYRIINESMRNIVKQDEWSEWEEIW